MTVRRNGRAIALFAASKPSKRKAVVRVSNRKIRAGDVTEV
jgi:aspartate carbamoyltransferase regulatory subunit